MSNSAPLVCRPAHRRVFSETGLDDDVVISSTRVRGEDYDADAACSRCSVLFSQEGLNELNSPEGLRHSSYNDCIASVQRGCPLCYFIGVTIERNQEEDGQDEFWHGDTCLIFRNRSSSGKRGDPTALSTIDVLDGYISDQDPIITIHPYVKKDDPLSSLIRRRPLERDVKSKKALDAAKRLYTECKDSHDACQFSRDSVLPSRVLDVGTAAEPSLKVFVNDTEQRGDYLALSYCWGGPQKGLLRRNTLDKMSSDAGIREKDLQKSVRDAVQVTRMLGFRYLWVDAFCIIQDCNKDKGKEIGRMATIYKNAALTIAAGTAARAADGFLGGKGTYLPEERAVVRTAGGRGTVYLRSGGYEPSHTLDSRGWVLQEFLLSSRLLIFSEYELLWQCKKTDLRGVNEGGLEYLQLLEGFPWTSFNEDNAGLFGSSDEEKKYLWKTVVEQYTRRLLSDPEDRLNALRGITRELEVLWEDSNYFGLWNRWFVELLAWYRPPDIHWQEKTKAGEKLTEKVQEQRSMSLAPSWSWASLNQTVMYKGYFIDEDARLKAVDVIGTRASRHVALSCRILRDEDIFSDELLEEDGDNDGEDKGIEECIDLKTIDEVGEKETEYLLLGTVMLEGATVGVGLMVVEAGDGFYKRVGLVRFMDMEVWKDLTYSAWEKSNFEDSKLGNVTTTSRHEIAASRYLRHLYVDITVHRVTSVSALLSAAAEQTDGFGNGGMEHAAASEKEGTGRRRWEM